MTTSKLPIFLSYRSVEANFADMLKKHLVKDFIGLVDVFLASDITSVPAGSRWLEEVVQGLKQSKFHIIICSPYSVYRPWINYEAGAARVLGTPIYPLCHNGLEPHQLPVPLSESEGGVLTHPNSLQKLYHRIAEMIGSSVPEVDFQKYADEFGKIEENFKDLKQACDQGCEENNQQSHSNLETIKNPHVLCVTSPQFRELGFENQLQQVLNAFPHNIKHDFVMNSTELQKILLKEQVDIIHIAAFVCPRGGDLYFSPVALPLGKSSIEDPDLVTPDSLVTLLKKAKTRLVVLGGSESWVLAAELLSTTHVIAARDMVSTRAMAKWVEIFYQTLTNESISTANEIATRISQAPMRLYGQQQAPPIINIE